MGFWDVVFGTSGPTPRENASQQQANEAYDSFRKAVIDNSGAGDFRQGCHMVHDNTLFGGDGRTYAVSHEAFESKCRPLFDEYRRHIRENDSERSRRIDGI